MKIVFTVPDGDYCDSCLHQEDFEVSEMSSVEMGRGKLRVNRHIYARCHLFGERIQGKSLDEMRKCRGCLKAGTKED